MSPIDRIAQLNAELGALTRENALLRSQLHDAQEQAKRDSETIARLSADKQDLDWLEDFFARYTERSVLRRTFHGNVRCAGFRAAIKISRHE